MRTIILGDIHGCYCELTELLEKLNFDQESDRLISLGDLIDRGKQSYEVFDFFRRLKQEMGDRCILIRGNHEGMLMDAARNIFDRDLWKRNGGTKTIKSFYQHQDQAYRQAWWFQANTVLYHEEERFRCCHAGFDRDELSENRPDILIWDRTRIERNDYRGKLTVVGHTPLREAVWLAGDEKTAEALPEHSRMALPATGMICLDTGCVFGGRLSAMVIEDGEYWLESAACREKTW